ncbi:MAG TPA: FtsW/RodA/SpoVE family cell cycle protein [Anaerolineaceae bacterium]|nr:FtsW/RodA/SpoVE family cell cycle protein [Anaerolineaceae bacterium]
MFRREIWRHFDYWLFGAVVFLCIFGVAMIRSAIAGNTVLAGSVTRQMIYVGLGLMVILVTAMIDYRLWSSLARPMYIFAVLSLVTIYIFGQALYGSARWLDTGLILIQPSELAKVIMILVLAAYFAATVDQEHNLRWVALSLAITGGVVVWIILQPNLSTSIVLMVLWFAMLFISGLPLRFLPMFAVGGVLLGLAAFPFLEEYQQARVLTFLFPDPNARHGATYNVEQALVTIGSGGLFGMGYGHGTQVQLRFLKVRHTDFIFAAMSEEFGFVGTVLIVGLLVFVILRCFRAARLAADPFGAFVAYGFGILLFFQTIVNIGVNLNILPVTGLTLPFISYGGSSLLSLVLGIGLVESVIAHHKPLDF